MNFWNKTLVQPRVVTTKKSEGFKPQENKPWWNKRLLKVVLWSSLKCMQTSWTSWRRDKNIFPNRLPPSHLQATLCQLLARIQKKKKTRQGCQMQKHDGQQRRNEALEKIWHLLVKMLDYLPQANKVYLKLLVFVSKQ